MTTARKVITDTTYLPVGNGHRLFIGTTGMGKTLFLDMSAHDAAQFPAKLKAELDQEMACYTDPKAKRIARTKNKVPRNG